jgi:hypothetical protein
MMFLPEFHVVERVVEPSHGTAVTTAPPPRGSGHFFQLEPDAHADGVCSFHQTGE